MLAQLRPWHLNNKTTKTMRQTLFLTALAAALLGGQVFATTYSVRDNWSDGQNVLIMDTEATIRVDAQKTLVAIVAQAESLTLDYQGEFVLTASYAIDTPGKGVLNITSTVDAVKTKWENAFSVEGGGSITLCHTERSIGDQYDTVQFFGTAADSAVQLGNSEVLYKGVVNALSDLAMNQVGVVWGEKEITLVGKVQKSVPEPTTGSLSLLALAGLCARRRRK